MKKLIIILLALLLIGCQTPVDNEDQVQNDIDSTELTKEIAEMEIDEELVEAVWNFSQKTKDVLDTGENQVYSPTSLYSALTMLLPAARESTLNELLEELSFRNLESAQEKLNPFFQKTNVLSDSYANLLTNSIWLNQKKEDYFDDKLLTSLKEDFYATSRKVDFSKPEESKKVISDFINERTNGFIKNLEVSIQKDSDLILLNTLYFKDAWLTQMHDDQEPLQFQLEDGNSIELESYKSKSYPEVYVDGDSMEMTTKGFDNGNTMVFIKPKGLLSDFIKDIDFNYIYRLINNLAREAKVTLRMPKVDISSKNEKLNELLKENGFDESMSTDPDLSYVYDRAVTQYVQNIIQQARITVDKEGAEAAAVTEVEIAPTSANPGTMFFVDFDLDKPYLMILLSDDNIPLFITTVFNPSQTD